MHRADSRFWRLLEDLPESVQQTARRNFVLLKANPRHPSLHFRNVGRYWSGPCGRFLLSCGRPGRRRFRLVLDWKPCRVRQDSRVIGRAHAAFGDGLAALLEEPNLALAG